ncbi:MAG: hypothetical protein EBU82_08430 [Flavobacteriia bacterium]|nr:hypothetical protein [Flavobacteriia bacterium]
MRQRCRITQGWKTKNQGQGTKIQSTTQPVLRRNEGEAKRFYVVGRRTGQNYQCSEKEIRKYLGFVGH